ncbi:glycosyltransferase family 4 protein [Desulfitobacterium sp. Sab5]|uniref:glycosyltransferase family 4 protein n=1 Tax=Desulfitobacterium nosdiversum TaxID=3375356 RepID=UPI003CF5FC88
MIDLKVLSLTNEFEEERFGGAGTAATGIVYMLDRLGMEQTVVVPRSDWNKPGRLARGQHINVLGLPRNIYYFGHLEMVWADALRHKFPELLQKWDVIHLQAINFAPLAYLLSEGRIPILYSVYSFLREELGDPKVPGLQEQFKIQEELLKHCHRIHLISQSEVHYLAEHFPQYLSKAEKLALGISLPTERWHQVNTNNRFLYVGRLLEYKGLEDLLKAISRVFQSGREISLDIVGKGPSQYEKYLKQLVSSLELEDSIQFHGWQPSSEVRQRMAHAAALIVPSWREAFGFVALEGMAIGIPLISSRAGGLAEIVSPSCALTFEAGNINQLSEALITAIDNPSLLKLFSERARERALPYEWDQLAPQYLNLLENMTF